MGGRDKGGDYRILEQMVQNHVKHLILLGEASQIIAASLGNLVPTERVIFNAGGCYKSAPGCVLGRCRAAVSRLFQLRHVQKLCAQRRCLSKRGQKTSMKAETPVRWRAYRKFSYDFRLFFPMLVLVGIGIVMVYSASSAIAIKKYGNDLYFLIKQSGVAVLGLIAMLIFRKIPYEFYRKYAYLFLVVAIGLLVAVKFTRPRD